MRKLIYGKIYDTEKAECLMHADWMTHHPNLSGRATLRHERGVYRTKSGKLFGYAYDEHGYGRDRDGVTGAYTRRESYIEPFDDSLKAMVWAELENCFEVEDFEKHFSDVVEEA